MFTRHEIYRRETLFQADRIIVAEFLFSSLGLTYRIPRQKLVNILGLDV